MEKRRRARINASLTELKALLLDAIKREGARQNKMEKADILELAVNHLRHIQRQQFTGETSLDTTDANKYQLGFHACVQEVCTYLDSNREEDLKLKTKLLNHLANCVTRTDYQTVSSTSPPQYVLPSTSSNSQVPKSLTYSNSQVPKSLTSSNSQVPKSPTSSIAQVPKSPTSTNSLSPLLLSPIPEHRVSSSAATPTSSYTNEMPHTNEAKNMQKFKIRKTSCSESVQEAGISSTPDGILHAVLTASSPTVLVKPPLLSWLPGGAVLSPPVTLGAKNDNTTTSLERTGQGQAIAVREINNNAVILPTVAASTPVSYLQQYSQLQPSYLCHQLQQVNQLQFHQLINNSQPNQSQLQQQLNQSQLNMSQINQPQINQTQPNQTQLNLTQLQQQLHQPQLRPQMSSTYPQTLLESSNIFGSVNPLQLIPTKTANGDIAFLLSAANFINTSNVPSFTIPVLAPPTLGHVAAPHQAFQIAVSCTPEEQTQSVALIAPQFMPLINSTNQNLGSISSFTTSHEATALNLSLTSDQSTKLTNQQVPNQKIASCNLAPSGSDSRTPSYKDVSSFSKLTTFSEVCHSQSALIGSINNRSSVEVTSQIHQPSGDAKDIPHLICLVSQRSPESRLPTLERDDKVNEYLDTLGQFQSIQQMDTESLWQETERQQSETAQKRLEMDRHRSKIEIQQREREQHLVEAERQPEVMRRSMEAEKQWFERERQHIETKRQQLETDQRNLETERQRCGRERLRQETDRQRTDIERQRTNPERRLSETDNQDPEPRLGTMSELPIFRPWRE